jgi:hypothetical protein
MLKPFKFLDNIADRVCAALGAVGLSQFPQFYGQYMQRLGGHLDEARGAYEQYVKAAADAGLSIEDYILEHLNSTSEVFRSSGRVIENLVIRFYELEQSYNALEGANIYNRWFVFLKEVDWSIAAGTWDSFVPGVPTTIEGLVYALAGLLVGWGIYALIKTVVSYPFKANAKTKLTKLNAR